MNQPLSGRGGIERVLRILAAMADLPGPIAVRRLADHVQLPDSTVYRLLGILREAGFVTDLGRDLGFALGPVCARLGSAAVQTRLVEEYALPEMQALSADTLETVALMVPVHRQMMCVRTVESPQSLRCSVREGVILPKTRGASAKAILAFQGRQIQTSAAANLPTEERNAFLDELAEIGRKGYATSESELDPGVWGVSAPILGGNGQLLGALTLMAPTSRASAQQETFTEKTVAACGRVAARLGEADQEAGIRGQARDG